MIGMDVHTSKQEVTSLRKSYWLLWICVGFALVVSIIALAVGASSFSKSQDLHNQVSTIDSNEIADNSITSSKLANDVDIRAKTLTASSTLFLSGAATLSNTLSVVGASTFSDTLLVSGNTTMSSVVMNTVSVSGAVTMSNTLSVAGAVDLKNALKVDGAVNAAKTLSVAGAAHFNSSTSVAGDVHVSGGIAIGTDLSVVGGSISVQVESTSASQYAGACSKQGEIRFTEDGDSVIMRICSSAKWKQIILKPSMIPDEFDGSSTAQEESSTASTASTAAETESSTASTAAATAAQTESSTAETESSTASTAPEAGSSTA